MARATLGVIVGNRDFFPDALVTEARADVLTLFAEMDIEAVIVDAAATKLGGVETRAEAKVCGELFSQNRDRIDGVLVVLPNFGDEKGVADTMQLSGLDVPVLVQAYPDDVTTFTLDRRRDAFCGKISVCNNLRQYGIRVHAHRTAHHPGRVRRVPRRPRQVRRVCRKVANGMRSRTHWAPSARGPTPSTPCATARSCWRLPASASSVVDLSEVFGKAGKLADDDARVTGKLDEIKAYVAHSLVPPEKLVQMAKLGVVLDDWMADNDLDATAIQCWNSLQENYGVNVCTLMSMMSNKLMPSACEVDITGVASMYALQLAAGDAGSASWTGTTTTATTPTSASSSTAATGRSTSTPRPR